MELNETDSTLAPNCFESARKQMGERIRQLWEQSGELQDIFAKNLGVSTVTLANYMNGKRKPDSEFLLTLKTRLNIRIDWLLTGDDSMRPNNTPQAQDTLTRTSEATALCARCAKLEAELDMEKAERRGLSVETRQMSMELREVNAENRRLARENGELRERCATLSGQLKCCNPVRTMDSAYIESKML